MQHIYSPEEYLKFEKISEELKDLELTRNLDRTLKPRIKSIQNIMNYSKALEIKSSSLLGHIESINN